jgi:hypothetical protein
MAKKPKKLTKSEIADQFEHLVNQNLMDWIEVTPQLYARLPPWSQVYLDWFKDCGITYQVARQVIQGHLCFKLDDPKICFFEHCPADGIHQWVGPNYHEALSSNEAIAYLASKKGVDIVLAQQILELTDKVIDAKHPYQNPELN